jgi:tRNA(Arg) A34 adenosine deaminase TadA
MMKFALEQAQMAAAAGEVPVGAVVVRDNKIIASAHNETIIRNDPTAHAEMLAIRAACATLKTNYLVDCDLIVTLEPCAMCAQALAFARVRRLIYAASDSKGGGVENGPRIFNQPTCHHRPEIFSGIEADAAGVLLKEFFASKRN